MTLSVDKTGDCKIVCLNLSLVCCTVFVLRRHLLDAFIILLELSTLHSQSQLFQDAHPKNAKFAKCTTSPTTLQHLSNKLHAESSTKNMSNAGFRMGRQQPTTPQG